MNQDNSEKSANYTYNLEAYNFQGNLYLRWKTNAPMRPQQDQIMVYQGAFPPAPSGCGDPGVNYGEKVWTWGTWNNQSTSPWNTGLPWGPGWNCAWIAQNYPCDNGPYTYVVQVTTPADAVAE